MKTKSLFTLCFILLHSSFILSAFAQGTAFSYQGRLNNGGNPASGGYDLTFTVSDSTNSPGTIIAGPITNAPTSVSNGLFTVTLDFGAGVFTGPNRWLEINVRTNGAGAFTTLVPRQKLTPAPYAISSGNAASAGSLSGTLPASQLTGTVPSGVLSGANGSGLTSLNASQLTSGTVADLRLSANVALRDANQTFSGANNFLGSVGIGTTTPATQVEVRGATAAGPSLRLTGVGGPGSKVGIDLATYDPVANGTTNAAARIEALDNNWSAGIDFQTKVPGASANALASQLFIQNSGNVGIGTNAPSAKLEVAGDVKGTAFIGDGSQLTGLFTPLRGSGRPPVSLRSWP